MNTTEIPTTGQLIFEKLGIDLDEVPIEHLAEYTAVQYYLTIHDEPPSGASSLQKMHRYLAAVSHLSNAKDKARVEILKSEIPEISKYLNQK